MNLNISEFNFCLRNNQIIISILFQYYFIRRKFYNKNKKKFKINYILILYYNEKSIRYR